jgi:hypothetical protein
LRKTSAILAFKSIEQTGDMRAKPMAPEVSLPLEHYFFPLTNVFTPLESANGLGFHNRPVPGVSGGITAKVLLAELQL